MATVVDAEAPMDERASSTGRIRAVGVPVLWTRSSRLAFPSRRGHRDSDRRSEGRLMRCRSVRTTMEALGRGAALRRPRATGQTGRHQPATRSTSVVKSIEGVVEAVAPKSGGSRVNVVAGQALTAGPDGLRPAVGFDVGSERTELRALLAPSLRSCALSSAVLIRHQKPIQRSGDGRIRTPGVPRLAY
jgi:hypothetical protein